MSEKSLSLPKWGFGAIVADDGPWTTPKNYKLLLDVCAENSIYYLDTAQRYGDAEKVLGDWISSTPSDQLDCFWIGSKVGKKAGTVNEFSTDYIFRSAQESLGLLGLDRLDIYWLHGPDRTTPWLDTLLGFNKVIKEDLAGSFGVCNVSLADMEEIFSICENQSLTKPQYVQNEFNLLNFKAEIKLVNFCKAENLHYTAFSPMAGGILTGKYELDQFPEDARWSHWKNTRGLPDYWTKAGFDKIDVLRKFAAKRNISLAALSLAWVANYDGVKTVLVGPRNLSHLDVIQDAQKLVLSDDEMKLFSELF